MLANVRLAALVLRYGRKAIKMHKSKHKHVILGHAFELLGTALTALRVELIGTAALGLGAVILIVGVVLFED